MVTKNRLEIFPANSEKQDIQMALRELKNFLDKIYRPNSPEMWVYGSYVRQEETLQSDIDVLLLYPKKIHAGQEIERISPVLAELNLRYQFLISILPVSRTDYQQSSGVFWNNVRRERVHLDGK
jgi:predicted nucleotidyltransferase